MAARKERVTESTSIDEDIPPQIPANDAPRDMSQTQDASQDSSPAPEEVIEKLKAEMAKKDEALSAERTAREYAEKESRIATGKATAATTDAVSQRETAYVMAIDKTQGDLDTAKRALKEALAGSDSDAVVDAQEAIADAKYHLNRVTDEKRIFDNWKEQEASRVAQPAPQQGRYSAAAQKWIDDHPLFNSDAGYNKKALMAEAEARADGITPDSVAYFRHINAAVANYESNAKPNGADHNAASVALPSSHESPTSTSRRPSEVRLTAEEREAAEISNMTEGEYAEFKYGNKRR